MKTPTAKQLPSGSWFVRIRMSGKDIGITKPTEAEAVAAAMAVKAGIVKAEKEVRTRILSAAIGGYIDARLNVCSPSTIEGYRKIQRTRFQSLMPVPVGKLTSDRCQRAVNLEAKLCSGKSLKNAWFLISAVIYEETGQRISVRLPQILPNERGFLTAEEIPLLVDALKGTKIEIPALLALSSLRQSEILGLRWESVDLGARVLRITETAVRGPEGLTRKPETKNLTSRRTVPIIPPLQAALEAVEADSGYVVHMADNTIRRNLQKISSEAGVPYVGLHGLRHSFASLAYHLGLSEEATMHIGGWSDISTMRKIYTHISDADIRHQSERFTSYFNSDCN